MKAIIVVAAVVFMAFHPQYSQAGGKTDAVLEVLKQMSKDSGNEDNEHMIESTQNQLQRNKKASMCGDQCVADMRNYLRPGERARCKDKAVCTQCLNRCYNSGSE